MVTIESEVSLKTGDSAPDFELVGTDDKKHALNDYDKKGLLIIFMCNHCPYVKAKIEAIKEIHAKFKGCLLYTSPSPRDLSTSRMPSSA